jgi:hypothetical protein
VPQDHLPGWITIRRVRPEHRGIRLPPTPKWGFRFMCGMCGSVGEARPTPSTAATNALEHVRSCVAPGPLGPRNWRGTGPRLSLTLQSHYQRMEEHVRSTPELSRLLDRNRPRLGTTIWRALRRFPEMWRHQVNKVASAALIRKLTTPFARLWAWARRA